MESWKRVWRNGFLPQIKTPVLRALLEAVQSDDPRLTQGSTSTPPPLMCVADWPIECGCLIGYAGAMELGGFETLSVDAYVNKVKSNPTPAKVGQVEEFFGTACFQADQRLGNPAECRWFLNWFDDTPRTEMRRELEAELILNLKEREQADGAISPPIPGLSA
jgi:hypothetical protein